MFTLKSFYRYIVYMGWWTGITAVVCYMCGAALDFLLGGILLTVACYILGPNKKLDAELKVCTFDDRTWAIDQHSWAMFAIIVISTIIMLVYSMYCGTNTDSLAIAPFDMTVPSWMEITTYSGKLISMNNVV